jgi:AraC-like DNA-binding protein
LSEKLVFSSNDLPPDLGETARFKLWLDIYVGERAALDISVSAKAPFEAETQAVALGPLLLTRMEGTVTGVARTAGHVAAEGGGDYCLLINAGAAATGGSFRPRETAVATGAAALQTFGEPLSLAGGDRNAWVNLILPRELLTAALPDGDSRLALEISAESEALRLLKDYCFMLEAHGPMRSADLVDHTIRTILDLVVLAAYAGGEAAEIADGRGLRAARLQAILAKVKGGFANPGISAQTVAQDLGLSARYVQDLLQETGIGFAERILELRLQKTRQMLSDRLYDKMLIGEIAYSAGFGDVSYFNRSFRRRFGCTPKSAR